jgi:hypothetical protein
MLSSHLALGLPNYFIMLLKLYQRIRPRPRSIFQDQVLENVFYRKPENWVNALDETRSAVPFKGVTFLCGYTPNTAMVSFYAFKLSKFIVIW